MKFVKIIPRLVSSTLSVILAGCVIIGIARFFVEQPTVLNIVVPLIVYAIVGHSSAMPWLAVQAVTITLAFMMAFAIPAYILVWMFQPIVSNRKVQMLIAAWFLLFMYLFMVGPELDYGARNWSIPSELPGWRLADFNDQLSGRVKHFLHLKS